MPFLTNDPLPQCLQPSPLTPLLLDQGHRRGSRRYLSNVKCLLFLNASCSPAVARAGCSGRGTWTDHPSARSASQPRWTATEASPSSPAIHAATLRLVHSPPSAGGPASRSRSLSSSSGFRIVALVPLRRRRSPSASGPPALYRASSFSTHRTPNAVVAATSATSWPFASSQIAWRCRAERVSAATRNRSPSSATLKCPATSATCPPPASQGPAYRLRHPAGTVTEHISRKPYETRTSKRGRSTRWTIRSSMGPRPWWGHPMELQPRTVIVIAQRAQPPSLDRLGPLEP